MSAGRYRSDHLLVDITVTLDGDYAVPFLADGVITILDPSGSIFTAVTVVEADTLFETTNSGAVSQRLPVTADLDAWAAGLVHSTVTASGSGKIGNITGAWWQIENTSLCADCWYPMFGSSLGFPFGTTSGLTLKIWTVETGTGLLLVVVESDTASFPAWDDEATTAILDGLNFAEPTGHSRSASRYEGAGDFTVGRYETIVVDSSRPTAEVSGFGGLAVEAAPHRSLLVSLTYPSDGGGYASSPAAGSFPIVLVAHELNGLGVAAPADYVLASHGFVVARILFPESSRPGGSFSEIREQPLDMSFVLDHLAEALPDDLARALDLDAVGVVGASLGATTTYGLVASTCCSDARIDAVVAHAATTFDFDDGLIWPAATPALLVGSETDLFAPAQALRDFHSEISAPGYLLLFDEADHLAWLTPDDPTYDLSNEAVVAFLSHYLADGPPIDLTGLDGATWTDASNS